MSLYVLDTDILSLYRRGHGLVLQRVASHSPSELAVTVITVEELLSGWYTSVRRAKNPKQLARAYQELGESVEFLSGWRILKYPEPTIKRFHQLAAMKLQVRRMDLRIAAITLENGGTLVTRNLRDFQQIPVCLWKTGRCDRMPKQLVPILLLALAAILVVIGFLDVSTILRLWISLGVLLLLISLRLLPFITAPIGLYRNHWLSARREFEIFHPGREVMPEEAWDHVCQAVETLRPYGFRIISHFQRSASVSGANSFDSLMEAMDRTTIAKLSTTFITKSKKASPAHSMLAFFTECEDGTEFVTANNTIFGNTPPSRRKRMVLWMPETRNPRELYAYHEKLVAKFVKTRKPFDFKGNPALYMKEYAETEVNHWAKKGYYRLDPTGEVYRLTWKGAVLIAWKNLWPIKPIRRAWRKHQTNKLLRKLEE